MDLSIQPDRRVSDNLDISHMTEKIVVHDVDGAFNANAVWSSPMSIDLTSVSNRILLTGPGRVLLALVPSFLQPQRFKKEHGKVNKIHSTSFLDGMRGLASFVVFICHLSYGTWFITFSYGAGAPGENTWLLQLPIVRLLYSGPPMVAIFFVISGYVLSYKPLRLIRARQYEDLMLALSSSIFRRGLRLFLPCFISTFFIACLAQLGLYRMTEAFSNGMRAMHEDHAPTLPSPYAQFMDWAQKMFAFVNVFDWSLYAGSIDLDRHLWTIPIEFRASMVLFITHVLVARMSTILRLGTLGTLIWWGLHWDRWDMLPFWSGAILAELDMIKTSREYRRVTQMDLSREKSNSDGSDGIWWKSFWLANFICGLFLASYPDAIGHVTPGYRYLTTLIPEYFTEKHRFWPSIGAVQIVWTINNFTVVKRIFTSPFLQYLGNISFPLYLMHGPVIHTLGYMVSRNTRSTAHGSGDRDHTDRAVSSGPAQGMGHHGHRSHVALRAGLRFGSCMDHRCRRLGC